MVRVLQCVSPFGVASSVLPITASTASSDTIRGAPTRGSSYNPSTRRAMNRRRHFATVLFVVRRRRTYGTIRRVDAREHDAGAKRDRTIDAGSLREANQLGPLARLRLPRRRKSPRAGLSRRSLFCAVHCSCAIAALAASETGTGVPRFDVRWSFNNSIRRGIASLAFNVSSA
jgi:hypothetical protein